MKHMPMGLLGLPQVRRAARSAIAFEETLRNIRDRAEIQEADRTAAQLTASIAKARRTAEHLGTTTPASSQSIVGAIGWLVLNGMTIDEAVQEVRDHHQNLGVRVQARQLAREMRRKKR
ncbi:MAG: hypothetical protein GY856_36850 [bacterium]|nr:hypothetical protein [bacterium]